MNKLTDKELLSVDGGSILGTSAVIGIGLLISAGVTFIAGIIDGIVRPFKCN